MTNKHRDGLVIVSVSASHDPAFVSASENRRYRGGAINCVEVRVLFVALLFSLGTALTTSAQTLNTLHTFCSEGSFPSCPDGAIPTGVLLQSADGNFYGTTAGGGPTASGLIFKITPAGELTPLYNFCPAGFPDCPDGYNPSTGLIAGADGNFYGATEGPDATTNVGVVFRVTPEGDLTTLYSFCPAGGLSCPDGRAPAGIVQGTDGKFYGTTPRGGNEACGGDGCGTVFKLSRTGHLTTLHTFCSKVNCADGATPQAALILGSDGKFYGTTTYGGSTGTNGQCPNGCGTIFSITSTGHLTILHNFCSQPPGCPDGLFPVAGLVEGIDGNFYGTTSSTIFKITPDGQLTTLYQSDITHGYGFFGTLMQGKDGNFYGVAASGGLRGGCNGSGCGMIFNTTPNGIFTPLYNFCSQAECADGATPLFGLVQGVDGRFYGSTNWGGTAGRGTLFSFGMGLDLAPAFGPVGDKFIVTGLNLTGTTGVTINGMTVAFKILSATQVKAAVPTGATSGPVQVTTPGGVLNSNTPFGVTPFLKKFAPTGGSVGTVVTITGVSLTQTTQITFGGVAASFTVDSDTVVIATVPSGASTGKIIITTAGGTDASSGKFMVKP
jgi:uncharacterized repeat protein (TIGR03803 family)